jgi:predicted metal-binding membrane protein
MGCCAALMLLLFAVAVMDLRWVVALTVLVTSEKLLPGAKIWRLTIGAGLLAIALGFAVAGWKSAQFRIRSMSVLHTMPTLGERSNLVA